MLVINVVNVGDQCLEYWILPVCAMSEINVVNSVKAELNVMNIVNGKNGWQYDRDKKCCLCHEYECWMF